MNHAYVVSHYTVYCRITRFIQLGWSDLFALSPFALNKPNTTPSLLLLLLLLLRSLAATCWGASAQRRCYPPPLSLSLSLSTSTR
jgi:hypothetical protein